MAQEALKQVLQQYQIREPSSHTDARSPKYFKIPGEDTRVLFLALVTQMVARIAL